jgi:hypothetical protein
VRDLAELTAADFAAATGSVFLVLDDQGRELLTVALADVTRLHDPSGRDRAFSLLFRGPQAPVLAPAIQRLGHRDLGDIEIFLGPIRVDADGTTYEAVFS